MAGILRQLTAGRSKNDYMLEHLSGRKDKLELSDDVAEHISHKYHLIMMRDTK